MIKYHQNFIALTRQIYLIKKLHRYFLTYFFLGESQTKDHKIIPKKSDNDKMNEYDKIISIVK